MSNDSVSDSELSQSCSRLRILSGRQGYVNSKKGVDVAISRSVKGDKTIFVFNAYLQTSFPRFNRMLKKAGILQYKTSTLSIVLDKLEVANKRDIDSWCDRNVTSNVDLMVIDTGNLAIGRVRKTKKLIPCLENLEYLSNKLDTDILLLFTGEAPHYLRVNIPHIK